MAATNALLERDDELEVFARALDRAVDGEGGLILVEGEAGAGKTALLGAAGDLAREREMGVLRARGGEFERDFPYGVVRQLFEPELAAAGSRAESLSSTAALAAPIFEPSLSATAGDPSAFQHGLYWLLADLATASPLALLVDDAQWADLASLQALVYCARRLDGLPVLLLATVRSGEAGECRALLEELRREPSARAIVPPPLSAVAAATLIAAAGRPSSPEFAAACCRASGVIRSSWSSCCAVSTASIPARSTPDPSAWRNWRRRGFRARSSVVSASSARTRSPSPERSR